jgi:hypothetical protein
VMLEDGNTSLVLDPANGCTTPALKTPPTTPSTTHTTDRKSELLALLPPDGLSHGEWKSAAKEKRITGGSFQRARESLERDGRIHKVGEIWKRSATAHDQPIPSQVPGTKYHPL